MSKIPTSVFGRSMLFIGQSRTPSVEIGVHHHSVLLHLLLEHPNVSMSENAVTKLSLPQFKCARRRAAVRLKAVPVSSTLIKERTVQNNVSAIYGLAEKQGLHLGTAEVALMAAQQGPRLWEQLGVPDNEWLTFAMKPWGGKSRFDAPLLPFAFSLGLAAETKRVIVSTVAGTIGPEGLGVWLCLRNHWVFAV